MTKTNPYFELHGLSHTAYLVSDMQRTIDFYEGVLGMPLVKSVGVPEYMGGGIFFFFDVGDGALLGFSLLPGAKAPMPGVSSPEGMNWNSIGALHHLALRVDPDKFDEYMARLTEKGISFTYMAHNVDDSITFDPTVAPSEDDYCRSVYFPDPDGALIEFCAWLPAWDRITAEYDPAEARRVAEALTAGPLTAMSLS